MLCIYDLIVIKVSSEENFGNCEKSINKNISERKISSVIHKNRVGNAKVPTMRNYLVRFNEYASIRADVVNF
jgi:hypothetical protein